MRRARGWVTAGRLGAGTPSPGELKQPAELVVPLDGACGLERLGVGLWLSRERLVNGYHIAGVEGVSRLVVAGDDVTGNRGADG